MPKTQPPRTAKELARAVSVAQEQQKQPTTKKPTLTARVSRMESTIERHDLHLGIILDTTKATLEHVDQLNHRIAYEVATSEELAMLRDRVNRIDRSANTAYRQAIQTEDWVSRKFKTFAPVNIVLGSVALSTLVMLVVMSIAVALTPKNPPVKTAPDPQPIHTPDSINANKRTYPRQPARIATTGK